MVIVPISKSHSRYRHTLWTFTAYIMFASPRRQAISAEEESTSVLLQGLGTYPSMSRFLLSHSDLRLCLSSVWKWLRVEERSFSPASPEVGEDDHTCDRRVRTPQRGEGVPFKRQNNQENRQICGAEDYHCPDLRKKQRTARCDHIQQRNR